MMIFVFMSSLYTESSINQRELRMQNPSSSRDDVDASTINLNATTKIWHPEKKYSQVPPDIRKARRIFALPSSQHSQLIQPRPFQDNRLLDFKKEYTGEKALKL